MELFQDTGIWVLLSFLVFCVIMWRFAKDKFVALLDQRIETIRKEIDAAEALRVEAQELLAQYQRKQRDAAKEAEHIVETARKHANEARAEAEKELEITMARREQQLRDRLARMQEKAVQDIQAYAAQIAVQATKEIIIEKMDDKNSNKLIDQSIKGISDNLAA